MLDNLLNLLAIAAWVFFGLLLVVVALRGFQIGGMREAVRAAVTWRVFLAFLLALVLSFASVSLVFVEPQEVGVVVSLLSRNGYREQPLRSGLHWIVPLAERVVLYPISWQTYTMSTEPLEGKKIGNDAIAARTSDGQAVFIDSTVIYRIDSNQVIRVNIDWQNRYVDDFIRPLLRGVIRTEVSQFTADEVNSSKRKNLESNLEEAIRQALNDKGFILDRFLLRNIAFSPQYASAIEQKQVAEQEQTMREYQAEQMRKLAEGERDKMRIEAQGKADAALLEGEAAAKVIVLKAQSDAEALRLINEQLKKNPNLIAYRYVDKLSPGIKVMLVPSNNPFLLTLPDMGATTDLTDTLTSSLTSTITSTLELPPVSSLLPGPTPTPGTAR